MATTPDGISLGASSPASVTVRVTTGIAPASAAAAPAACGARMGLQPANNNPPDKITGTVTAGSLTLGIFIFLLLV
jgi:hypothetical protein